MAVHNKSIYAGVYTHSYEYIEYSLYIRYVSAYVQERQSKIKKE